ncbi:hypothetical protein B7R25_00245 [Subtercola boreus]|uniref:Pentapeptide repeat-containing protein n=1 Tax=Subtercola boreus TaxID=120213 RepID=A0A3E0WHF1_9MICO|nr:hypothetical protein B7R24_00250 [Subtercola boreus]RFA24076.1 hypothetical protein B7R23_00250 [Subtercola boreus]RFA29776.1 hypothetical protein B7R25_00245 [Subtercola boreus]
MVPDRLTVAALDELVAGDSREREHYEGGAADGEALTGCSFLECRFTGVTLTDAELRGSRFVETVFEAPFAHTLKAARTTWRDVRVVNPRWGSAELFDSELDSVHLTGGKIDYLNLRGSRLSNVVLEGCTITDLDLADARVTRVAFVDCRIGTLDVTRASCCSVDLRSSEFSRLHGIEGLAGATIDDLQLSLFAPLFAEHLGLRVEG